MNKHLIVFINFAKNYHIYRNLRCTHGRRRNDKKLFLIFAGRKDFSPFALEPVKKGKTAGKTGRKTRRRHVDVVDQKRQDCNVNQGVDPVNQKHKNCVEYCSHQGMRLRVEIKRNFLFLFSNRQKLYLTVYFRHKFKTPTYLECTKICTKIAAAIESLLFQSANARERHCRQ